MNAVASEVIQPVRIDLGAGKNPRQGFVGVDSIDFGNGNIICHIGSERWPWDDSSVDEAHCSHVLEHLTNFEGKWERVHFFNELWRVLKPGASCTLIFPHWSSSRYYGDPTHKEVISEFAFYYLDPKWRTVNAPHTDIQFNPNGYKCDLEVTWGYALDPAIQLRNADYQQHATRYWLEAQTGSAGQRQSTQMTGGFQVGPFQLCFQQGTITVDPPKWTAVASGDSGAFIAGGGSEQYGVTDG